jgi:hypothetical protein
MVCPLVAAVRTAAVAVLVAVASSSGGAPAGPALDTGGITP